MNELQKFRTTADDKRGNLKKQLVSLFPVSTESGYYLDRYETVTEAIKEWIVHPFSLAEIKDGIEGGLQGSTSVENAQTALTEKLTKELERYLYAESVLNRGLRLAQRKTFEMNGEVYYQAPTAIIVSLRDRTVETIRYKAKSATGMTKGIKGLTPSKLSQLEKFYDLYADLKYVHQNIGTIAPEFCDGKPYTINANYYFLQKTTDKKYFSQDFFSEDGNSIVGLSETHSSNETPHSTEMDDLFAEYLEQATTVGFDCDKSGCTFCDYKSFCNYTKANVKQDLKTVHASALGTPSESQQRVIDAACTLGEPRFIKVNAGAGSGKTYTLTALYINLVKFCGYKPQNIFISSFTNAGVSEIKSRIASAASTCGLSFLTEDRIHAFTFDSFYYQLISKNYQLLGFPEIPKMLKADMQMEYIEELVNSSIICDVDYSRMNFNNETGTSTPWILGAVSKAFGLIQTYRIMNLPNPANILEEKLKDARLFTGMSENSVDGILGLYEQFEERLKNENLLTYSHFPELVDRLLSIKPDLFDCLKYKYIIVDEFQDSNEYQVETIRRMSQSSAFEKMIVVGDDAQAIYGFRDTTPEYIIHFGEYIGQNVYELPLLENRRSTPEIIHLANQVIDMNDEKIDKALIATRPSGIPVSIQGFHSKNDERKFIVDKVEQLIKSGQARPEDICIIDRKRSGLSAIGTLLSERGIPWVSKVGQNLLTNSKVKAALSLCDAFYDPDVTSHYFDFLVAKYDGKIMGNSDTLKSEMETLHSVFENMDTLSFEQQREILHSYLDSLKNVEDDEIYEYFLELLYDNDDLPSELEYSRVFKKYGHVMEKKLDQNYLGVTLVTAHSSKGCEWPIVFNSVTNYDSQRLHSAARNKDLEEMRRLLFVSITRAKDLLYLTGVYVAYGSEKDGYGYNQFVRDLYNISGQLYDPVDHAKIAAREEKRKAAKAARAKKSRGVDLNNLTLF